LIDFFKFKIFIDRFNCDNICFNTDVVKEISAMSQYTVKDSLGDLRKMVREMYIESAGVYDDMDRDGTRANDMDFPVQKTSRVSR
jgi:hypothetical protein